MKINKVKIGGKAYEVAFLWSTISIYEDETNRNLSYDLVDMNKISFISRIFASGLITVQRYKKVEETSFVDALGILENLKGGEDADFRSNVLKWFLLSLPENKGKAKEVEKAFAEDEAEKKS